MIFPNILRGLRGDTNTVDDGAVVPRLAHAVAVHISHAHVGDHLRWRHGDDFGICHRVDAVRRHPVVQPHGVRAGRESLGKGVFALLRSHQFGKTCAIHRAFVRQFLGQRDRLAVLVQRHQHRHVFFSTTYAQMHAIGLPHEHVGHVIFTRHNLVTDASPAGFLTRDDFDTVLLVDTQNRRHHDAGAVSQRNETDFDLGFLWRI